MIVWRLRQGDQATIIVGYYSPGLFADLVTAVESAFFVCF